VQATESPLGCELVRCASPLLTQLGFAEEVGVWIERLLEVEKDPRNRLTLMICLGGALWLSAPETFSTTAVYTEAYRLARDLGDLPRQTLAAWGLVLTACSARRPRQALAASLQVEEESCAQLPGDPILDAKLIHAIVGVSRHLQADYKTAEHNLRWIVHHYPPDRHQSDLQALLYDPRQTVGYFLAWIELFSGRLTEAAATADRAISESYGHAPSIFTSITRAACAIAVDSMCWAAARQYVSLLDLHCGHQRSWRVWVDVLGNILAIHDGRSLNALKRLDEFLSRGDFVQSLKRQTWYYVQLVRGHMAFGHVDRARALLNRILIHFEDEEENWWKPEMITLEACLLAPVDPVAAHTRYRKAITIARAEGSTLLELKAAFGFMRSASTSADRIEAKSLARSAYERLVGGSERAGGAENRKLLHRLLLRSARLQRYVAFTLASRTATFSHAHRQ
jgi:hypothetical protein